MFSQKNKSIDPFLIKDDNPDIKDKKINDTYRNLYVAESDVSLKSKTLLRPVINTSKVNLFWIVVIIILTIFTFRTTYLQIWQGQYFAARAEGNRIKTIPIKAKRGIIYDHNMEIIARNIPFFNLEITKSEYPFDDYTNLYNKLNNIDTFDQSEVENLINNEPDFSVRPIEVMTNINYQDALKLKLEFNNIPGINITLRGNRLYPLGKYTSHLLGYLGKLTPQEIELVEQGKYLYNDYLGKAGLELQYEDILKGKDGYKQVEINALGQEQNIIEEIKPEQGKGLRLHLDSKLQKKIFDELSDYSERVGSNKAAAIAINPNNGAVLAMVSLPSYDNNIFGQNNKAELEKVFTDEDQPLFFRPVQGEYPSGSTFKPIVATAALAEKLINENTTFLSNGGIKISRWFFPDWKAGGHGLTNVTKAIAESVNTFFYIIGGGYNDFTGLGVQKIVEYAKKFGLTKITKIDYPTESSGFLPSKEWKEEVKNERWYIGDTYNLSIGQGDVLVTPLQMAIAYAAILNGGKIMKPQLVDGFIDESDDEFINLEPRIISDLGVDQKVLNTIKNGLGNAVSFGSARYLSNLEVSSGGKTGTAQVGGDKDPHAWFISFAPYENPEILLVVLIENGIEGSSTAVPVAYNVFKWYFSQ